MLSFFAHGYHMDESESGIEFATWWFQCAQRDSKRHPTPSAQSHSGTSHHPAPSRPVPSNPVPSHPTGTCSLPQRRLSFQGPWQNARRSAPTLYTPVSSLASSTLSSSTGAAPLFTEQTFGPLASFHRRPTIIERPPASLASTTTQTGATKPPPSPPPLRVWSGSGWLSKFNVAEGDGEAVLGGMIDFAGSGVVHMTGGVAGAES